MTDEITAKALQRLASAAKEEFLLNNPEVEDGNVYVSTRISDNGDGQFFITIGGIDVPSGGKILYPSRSFFNVDELRDKVTKLRVEIRRKIDEKLESLEREKDDTSDTEIRED